VKVTVEWLDGTTRTYDNVGEKHLTRDSNLLVLWGHRAYGGPAEHVASIPLGQVREYRVQS
jgi:hypothetical protein